MSKRKPHIKFKDACGTNVHVSGLKETVGEKELVACIAFMDSGKNKEHGYATFTYFTDAQLEKLALAIEKVRTWSKR